MAVSAVFSCRTARVCDVKNKAIMSVREVLLLSMFSGQPTLCLASSLCQAAQTAD